MNEPENLELKIIETAKQLFIKKGYSETSMSEIATTVGINRPTLHYYYRTKDKLFEAVFYPILGSFIPKIEWIASLDISLEEKLEKIIDEYFSLYLENPFLPQFVIGESQRDVDHLFDAIKKLKLDNYVITIDKAFKKEMEKGTIRKTSTRIFFLTFIGQIIIPFLAKNLVLKIFEFNEEEYRQFIDDWKLQILQQLKLVLFCNDKEFSGDKVLDAEI